MLILLFIILIIFIVICFKIDDKNEKAGKYDGKESDFVSGWVFLSGFSIFAEIVILIVIIIMTCLVVDSTVIDDKIKMYQEENSKIEKDITDMVNDYKQHEVNVFNSAEVSSPMVLVQMYPELKSDTLVKQQMDIYISNNNLIKELKCQQIDYNISKWWLYFNL